MPQGVTLESYTLRVRQKYVQKEDQEYESLGAIGGEFNFFGFLEAFLREFGGTNVVDEDRQSVLRIDDSTSARPQVHGEVIAGGWGVRAELRDYETGALAHTRSENEAQVVPHYFLVDAPDDTERGILLLQRLGRSGIKSHFCSAMKSAFTAWTNDRYLLEVFRQVPGSVFDRIQRGEIKKVELLTYDMPNELSEVERAVRGDHPEWDEVRGTVSVELSAKRTKRFQWQPWMRSLMVGERTFHEIQEDLGIPDNSRIKLEVDYGGKTRKIDLAHPGKISPYIDITNDVEFVEGQPRIEDIHEAATELLGTLVRDVRAREHDQ